MLRLRPLDLPTLDSLPVDAFAVFAGEDERPLVGLGGLLDWRLGGGLSRLMRAGVLKGSASEALLTSTNGGLPAARVFVVGLGPLASVTTDAFAAAARQAAQTLRKAGVKSVAIGLPDQPKAAVAARLVADAFGGEAMEVFLLGAVQELALALPDVALHEPLAVPTRAVDAKEVAAQAAEAQAVDGRPEPRKVDPRKLEPRKVEPQPRPEPKKPAPKRR